VKENGGSTDSLFLGPVDECWRQRGEEEEGVGVKRASYPCSPIYIIGTQSWAW
jgi:hypothetical protein